MTDRLQLLRFGSLRLILTWLGVTVLTMPGRLAAAEELVAIDFRNRIPGVLDAPVYDFDGVTPLGNQAGFEAELHAASSPDQLAPAAPSMMFGSGANAGYWPSDTSVPSPQQVPPDLQVALGQSVFYRVWVWEILPLGPFGKAVPVCRGKVYSMVVTNSVMPLVGFESFSLTPEELRIRRQGDQVVIEWDYRGARQYDLEATSSLQPPVQWQTVFTRASYGDPYEVISVTNALTSTPQFYRLERWR